MIETRRLKNVVIFMQTILSFVLSRKTLEYDSRNLWVKIEIYILKTLKIL